MMLTNSHGTSLGDFLSSFYDIYKKKIKHSPTFEKGSKRYIYVKCIIDIFWTTKLKNH